MNGTVELHGAKLVVNCGHTISQIQSTCLIPGDQVIFTTTGTASLNHRREQVAIAVIRYISAANTILWIATLPITCPFQPSIPTDPAYKVGDRLVIWLHSDGSITVHSRFSAAARDDMRCILDAYCSVPTKQPLTEYYEGHHYTIDNIVDHTDLDTFTIDPESSVDFDDAISVDPDNQTVYIHIVDIAGNDAATALCNQSSKRMRERCLSLYLANEHTEHLIAQRESLDTISLVKDQVRPVITVRVQLLYGEVQNYDIYRSTIVVKRRWNYLEVATALADGTAPEAIRLLAELHTARSSDVDYSFALPSLRLTISPYGLPLSVKQESTNDVAHGLVATAMILANLVVSKHLQARGVIIPNRFHETLRGYKHENRPVTGHPTVDSFILVKRFARAYYAIDQCGHFGLGLTDYVHFTSPMRRYADVLIHKLLAGWKVSPAILEQEVAWINTRAHFCKVLQDLYTHWKVIHWIKSVRVLDPVYCTDVKRAGVMWYMPSLLLNGFTHVSGLVPSQFWTFNEEDHTLSGSQTNHVVSVGQKMVAILNRIDPCTCELQLLLSYPTSE